MNLILSHMSKSLFEDIGQIAHIQASVVLSRSRLLIFLGFFFPVYSSLLFFSS